MPPLPAAIGLLCALLSVPLPERVTWEPASWAAERERFPSQLECEQALAFNREFTEHCQLEINRAYYAIPQDTQREHFWEAAYYEATRARGVWVRLCLMNDREKALALNTPEAAWRGWLTSLKHSLGDAAFFEGRMPDPAPFHRFAFVER